MFPTNLVCGICHILNIQTLQAPNMAIINCAISNLDPAICCAGNNPHYHGGCYFSKDSFACRSGWKRQIALSYRFFRLIVIWSRQFSPPACLNFLIIWKMLHNSSSLWEDLRKIKINKISGCGFANWWGTAACWQLCAALLRFPTRTSS